MIIRLLIIALLAGILQGCTSLQPVKSPPLDSAARIDTMTSAVALSLRAGEKGISGRGYLVMRYPDQFRLMILSPFGTTLAEIFLSGDELLYLDTSKKLAYHGMLSDLPDVPALQGWRLLRWATERVSAETPGQGRMNRMREEEQEVINFDNQGLVLKKSAGGDEVRFEEYHAVSGVPVPAAMEIIDRSGITVKITFDEPEINAPLDANAFVPALEGVTVLPLEQFPS